MEGDAGTLTTGHKFKIDPSAKKAPGLVKGEYYIATLIDNEQTGKQLGRQIVIELLAHSVIFAFMHEKSPGAHRVVIDGGGVDTRNHLHIHIMLPADGEELPPIVAPSSSKHRGL